MGGGGDLEVREVVTRGGVKVWSTVMQPKPWLVASSGEIEYRVQKTETVYLQSKSCTF